MKACDSQNGNDGERNRPAQPEAFGVRFKRKAAGLVKGEPITQRANRNAFALIETYRKKSGGGGYIAHVGLAPIKSS
jgi:hypothetical protein